MPANLVRSLPTTAPTRACTAAPDTALADAATMDAFTIDSPTPNPLPLGRGFLRPSAAASAAVAELWRLHGESARLVARCVAGPADAEDAVQEAFCRILAYGRAHEREIDRGYVLAVVRNAARACRGRRGGMSAAGTVIRTGRKTSCTRFGNSTESCDLERRRGRMAEAREEEEVAAPVCAAMARMGSEQASVLELGARGLGIEAIAAALQMPVRTAARRRAAAICTAREAVAEFLKRPPRGGAGRGRGQQPGPK